MPCDVFDIEDGTQVIVCSRGQRNTARCSSCGGPDARWLCDWPLGGAKAGQTCDRALCARCRRPQGQRRIGLDAKSVERDAGFSQETAATVAARAPRRVETVDYCPAHAELAAGKVTPLRTGDER